MVTYDSPNGSPSKQSKPEDIYINSGLNYSTIGLIALSYIYTYSSSPTLWSSKGFKGKLRLYPFPYFSPKLSKFPVPG